MTVDDQSRASEAGASTGTNMLATEPTNNLPEDTLSLAGTRSPDPEWVVELHRPTKHGVITRTVTRQGELWGNPNEVVWPTWVPGMSTADEMAPKRDSGVKEFLDYWSGAGDKIRDAAKWSATVLSATLGALIGTSPLTVAREDTPSGWAIFFGLAGLIMLAICLRLVLNVLLPQVFSFEDLQHADSDGADGALTEWCRKINKESDLYLPSGVSSLSQLREAVVVEDLTLDELAKLIYDGRHEESPQVVDHCKLALHARTGRLDELKRAADQLVTIGGFQQLRHRGEIARTRGVILGTLATVLIVAAFAWPSSVGPYSEKQVQLSAQGVANLANTLGTSCNRFSAVVLEDKGDRFHALVRPNDNCRGAEVWIDQKEVVRRGPP
jgi:hypothetical protein